MNRWLVAAALLATGTAAAQAQDAAAGEKVFARCTPCHSVGPDAKKKVGPILNGLDGRKAGTVEGYSYSEANRNSGIVWNEETFLHYIQAPQKVLPGTKMFFPGLVKEQERKDIWAYLKQFAADGAKKP